MKFNLEGVEFQKGSEVLDDKATRDFYEYLERETKETFASFDAARRKSAALAASRVIG